MTHDESEMALLRERMVHTQIAERGLRDEQILLAMLAVARHRFVPEELAAMSYADRPLPIGEEQTISQPFVVALMTRALLLQPSDNVLEIGTGSGYAAAVLSRLVARVYTIERRPALAQAAAERLAAQGYANVEVRCGDGTLGWAEAAPFDAIVVTAGGPAVPQSLALQLAIGGRMVIPVGDRSSQELVRVTRHANGFEREVLEQVRFVPLVGAGGWS